RISIRPDGLFDYDERGPAAEIFPIFARNGALEDMVAWRPDRPHQWWLYHGTAVLAGAWALDRAAASCDPLRLASCPATWVRDTGATALLLRPQQVDLFELIGGIEIECSEDYAAWLTALVAKQHALRWRPPSWSKSRAG